MSDYKHKEIETKWQRKWLADGTYQAADPSTSLGASKPKYYALVEFPYPSGDGLHVGHPRPYIGMDIIARQKRMAGHNVLYPMGWDAFGLPAENYAIKVGIHPAEVTKKNADNFRRQIQALGISFDWSREINTTDPAYYKWTQWIFLQLFKKGLAYKAKTTINWCPSCKIGLANEEVIDGKCERCGTAVEPKEKEQWLLKITEYAQRLYDDLDTVDYIERAKVQQRNWIGPSAGAEISFQLSGLSFQGNYKLKAESQKLKAVQEVVFASNNLSKLKRMQNLFNAAGLGVTLKMPVDIGIKDYKVVEDAPTLQGNAEKKARTLAAQTHLPVFADDTGFFIEGTELDPVTVKRNALNGEDEHSLTLEEICQRMRQYYMDLATARGGQVPAEWRSALCLITPDKQVKHFEVARPVTLTNQFHGVDDPHLPLRGLYIPKATGKYPADYTPEDELKEMEPITEGIKELFIPAIKIFTTRPDTIFGATYLAISPKLALELTGKDFGVKTDEGRENKDKVGVDTGLRVTNPANGAELPVWVVNYVSADYGTGAIMAVPAHDERDFELAKKYNLPIKPVVAYPVFNRDNPPRAGKTETKREVIHAILRNPKNDTYLVGFLKDEVWGDKKPVNFVIGGVEAGEDFQESAAREIIEETGYTDFKLVEELPIEVSAKFFQAQKDVNRTAHIRTFVFELQSTTRNPVAAEEEAKHEFKWLPAAEVSKALNVPTDQLVWDYYRRRGFAYADHGPLINSGEFNGLNSEAAMKQVTEKIGGRWITTYKLRDWIFSRQRYWGEPIPLVYCEKDGWVAVPEDQLPVELPQVEKYQPTDTGESPLANITDWVETTCPTCGGPAKRETDVMPNWAGSSWYYLRYLDPKNNKTLAGAEKLNYWSEIDPKLKAESQKLKAGPVDWYNGGMEHTVLHLLYSRFWHKFLYDIGVVPTSEPYAKRTSHGLILAEGGEKMSKSKGNVVNPDSIVETYGADTLRLYEMFIGPFDQAAAWSTDGIVGPRRFLERVWRLQADLFLTNSSDVSSRKHGQNLLDKSLPSVLHSTIKKVTEDIAAMRFNTAVSSLMVLLGVMEKSEIGQADWEIFLQLLAPFAPHLAEELWAQLGHQDSVHLMAWPDFNPALIMSDRVKVVVQVNGTVRDILEINTGLSEAEVKNMALNSQKVVKWLGGKEPKRIIYVPDKLINFVIQNQ